MPQRIIFNISALLERHPIFINCLILLIGTPLVLNRHRSELMNGLDGEYMRVLISQQREWTPIGLGLPLSPFEGMANVQFPFNAKLIPAYGLQMLFASNFDPVFSYTLFVVELFLA